MIKTLGWFVYMELVFHYPYPDFPYELFFFQLPALFIVLSFLTWLGCPRIDEV